MHALAEDLTERRLQQMRRRVVSLRVPSTVARHARDGTAESEGPAQRPERGRTALHLLHVVDVHTPAVADDFAAIGDLAAGFGVEWRLLQQHGDAAAGEVLDCRHFGFGLDHVVADEPAGPAVAARGSLPACAFVQRFDRNPELARLSLVLRPLALG